MTDFKNLTIKSLKEGLLNKEFSVSEVVAGFIGEINKKNREIGAYLDVFEKESIDDSKKLDSLPEEEKLSRGVFGVPLALKDNMLVEGFKTTAASKILKNYVASYDATVIKKLRDAGAIFLGKANMDEFAMGSSTENSAFLITKNPRDLERVPGGSSGGSAAAVASGMALASLGSDTGGSIRQPAAFCGVVGLKPTYGTVSRSGLIAMASSLDQIGPITKTVEDAELIFKNICGKDELDSTTVEYVYEEIMSAEKVNNLKIGLPKEYFISGLSKEVEEGVLSAIERFKKLGFQFKEISLPHTKYALSCYYIIMPAEVSSNLARFDGIRYSRNVNSKSLIDTYLENRGEGFGDEVRRRILLGTFVLSAGYYDAYYAKAQKVRNLIKNDFDEAFKEVDVILSPVTPTPPFKIGEKSGDPIQMYLSDVFTIPANLAGLPAVSIPVGKKSNLPVGFQLMGRHFEENKILALGKLYEGNN